jgi:CHAD domain-containing protein
VAAEVKRKRAHRDVSAELGSASFARVIVGIATWIADGASGLPPLGDKALDHPIADIAPHLLDRMLRNVVKHGRHIDDASREQLHVLRKAIKNLRYSAEFLSGLYRHKQVEAYLGPCEDLQELLGTVNDAAVIPALAQQLCEGCEALGSAISSVTKWATVRSEKARHQVSKPWDELCSADHFWH